MEGERPQVSINVDLPRCPYCHEDVRADEPKHGCEACFAWHHAECWGEGGGRCSACGAEGTKPEAPRPKRRGGAAERWRSAARLENTGASQQDIDRLLGGGATPYGEIAARERVNASYGTVMAATGAVFGLLFVWQTFGVVPGIVLMCMATVGLVVFLSQASKGRLYRKRRRKKKKTKSPKGGKQPTKGED